MASTSLCKSVSKSNVGNLSLAAAEGSKLFKEPFMVLYGYKHLECIQMIINFASAAGDQPLADTVLNRQQSFTHLYQARKSIACKTAGGPLEVTGDADTGRWLLDKCACLHQNATLGGGKLNVRNSLIH